MYRIFCIPASKVPSNAAKLWGIRVTPPESGDRCQSSTNLIFSASLFHAAQSAVTHLSLDAPTSVFRRSRIAPSPRDAGPILAISDAPEPTSANILER